MEQDAYQGPERRWTPRYLRVGPLALPYVSREKAIQTIERSFEDRKQIRIAFCNANTMLKALDSRDYADKLGSFLMLNDGIGVDLASMIHTGERFPENLNGTDFVPDLLGHTGRNLRIYLLGGKQGVAEKAACCLIERYPSHQVVGVRNGYFKPEEADTVVAEINDVAPDLLLVALGNPRQEEFIATYREKIDAPVLIGVGALLDFVAGRVVRAPDVFRTLRLEWLFRLLQEPRRLSKRYTIDTARFLVTVTALRLWSMMRGPSQRPLAPRLRPDN